MSVTICFHSFLRFSSCPRKQCTDTLCVELNCIQSKELGGAGRFGACSLSWKMEQIPARHGQEDDVGGAVSRFPSIRIVHTPDWGQASNSSLSKCHEYQLKHLSAGKKNKPRSKARLMLHCHGCRVDRFYQKGCNISLIFQLNSLSFYPPSFSQRGIK